MALVVASGIGMVACGSPPSATALAAEQAYVAAVHEAVPTIYTARSDAQLVRLGQAVCSDLSTGIGVQAVADRLGSELSGLPAATLGAVITAAADHLCPSNRSVAG